MRLARLYPKSTLKPATRTIVIPKPVPTTRGAAELADQELLEWVRGVLKVITPVTVSEKSS
jgi:transcription-repair coupling factor (superfamily II helicase)